MLKVPWFLILFFRGKRWDEALEKPDLDYSEIFEPDVGQIPGVLIIFSSGVFKHYVPLSLLILFECHTGELRLWVSFQA